MTNLPPATIVTVVTTAGAVFAIFGLTIRHCTNRRIHLNGVSPVSDEECARNHQADQKHTAVAIDGLKDNLADQRADDRRAADQAHQAIQDHVSVAIADFKATLAEQRRENREDFRRIFESIDSK